MRRKNEITRANKVIISARTVAITLKSWRKTPAKPLNLRDRNPDKFLQIVLPSRVGAPQIGVSEMGFSSGRN